MGNVKTLSRSAYNCVIGLTLLWGFLVNYLIVTNIPVKSVEAIHPAIFLAMYFLCCIIGTIMFNESKNPIISFIGYNLVVVPFGFVLNLFVSGFDSNIIAQALLTTGLVTALMLIITTIKPEWFDGLGTCLLMSLITVVITEIVLLIIGIDLGVIDWLVAFIFSLYIGYDWQQASDKEKTLDNAIDSAAELYIDIINLFVRVVSILAELAS